MTEQTQSSKRIIYIDALALVPEKKSGIGYSLEQTFRQLVNLPKIKQHYIIYLVVPLGKAKYIKKYLRPNVRIKTIYLPAKVLEVLLQLNIFPPIDWLLGSGVYIFPNYRNWPLWHSSSLTYIYDLGFIRYPETVQPKNQRYLARYIKRWILRADRVLTITEQMKEEIEKYLNVLYTKIEVVYCGVDQTVFHKRTEREIDAAIQKYHVPYRNYLLFVGNIEPRKNLVILLDAYACLPEPLRNEYGLLLVGGDGWLNEKFYQKLVGLQAKGYKIFKVKDYVQTEDLPALYSGASALVHPAIYEGFGMTPLEAMACEVPVVVSDIPAIREVVQDSGYYFNPNSVKSIAEAMRHALLKRGNTEFLTGEAKIAGVFTWQKTARQLLEVVDSVGLDPTIRPVLKRLKSLYKKIDQGIRAVLGEKTLMPYRPKEAKNEQELRKIILHDFLAEQPNTAQVFLLSTYQAVKHSMAVVVKKIYRTTGG